jgi:hypothetical protein
MEIIFDDISIEGEKSGTYFLTSQYIPDDILEKTKKISVIDGDDKTEYLNPKIEEYKYDQDLEKYILGFCVLSETEVNEKIDSIIDENLDQFSKILPTFTTGMKYTKGNMVVYENSVYRVLQDHTSQNDWTPDKTASLFVKVAGAEVSDSGEVTVNEWPNFVQPTGATDAYSKDSKVTFEGCHYISLIDNNVWSPVTYPDGWTKEE